MGGYDAGTVAGGVHSAGLGPLDLGGEVANREVAIAAWQRCRERSQQTGLSLEDRRRLAAMDARPEMAELAKGGGVERGGGDGAVAGGDEARPHLARRLVRERDDKDVPRAARRRSRGHMRRAAR